MPPSATSSLWEWLRTHPAVFLPSPKEPHYFSFDYPEGECRTLEDYELLFKNAKFQLQAIGEASTGYLRSATAIPAIQDYAGNPKIVVAIRNPVDMAVSFHNYQLLRGFENVEDFWIAWHLQNSRH